MKITLNSQNILNKQSRRDWLRGTAVAATSALVMPSLLTGCSDHRGLGSVPPESDLYSQAVDNLHNMRDWYQDLYQAYTSEYVFTGYTYLKGGKTAPTSWKDIFVDIFTQIGIGILEAVFEEFPGVGPAIAASIEGFEEWASGEKGGNVDTTIGVFSDGLQNMHIAINHHLNYLASSTDNYKNLREAFNSGAIEFNGKTYTLQELAQHRFPDKNDDNYDDMIDVAFLKFKKYFWNAMFLQAGELKTDDSYYEDFCNQSCHPTNYAEQFYKDHPSYYLRGYYDRSTFIVNNSYLYYQPRHFIFDGKDISKELADILFKDTTPGKITNPNALFTRDYVYKQFVRGKTDFKGFYEIRKDDKKGPCLDVTPYNYQPCAYFDPDGDNYVFTGGEFQRLIKK